MAVKFSLRASVLDAAVRELKAEIEEKGKCSGLLVNPPEPWNEPVRGADLLNLIWATLRRHLILPNHTDTLFSAIALIKKSCQTDQPAVVFLRG